MSPEKMVLASDFVFTVKTDLLVVRKRAQLSDSDHCILKVYPTTKESMHMQICQTEKLLLGKPSILVNSCKHN